MRFLDSIGEKVPASMLALTLTAATLSGCTPEGHVSDLATTPEGVHRLIVAQPENLGSTSIRGTIIMALAQLGMSPEQVKERYSFKTAYEGANLSLAEQVALDSIRASVDDNLGKGYKRSTPQAEDLVVFDVKLNNPDDPTSGGVVFPFYKPTAAIYYSMAKIPKIVPKDYVFADKKCPTSAFFLDPAASQITAAVNGCKI